MRCGQYQQSSEALPRMSNMLRVGEPELVDQVTRLLDEKREHERQICQLWKTKIAQSAAIATWNRRSKEKNGVRYLTGRRLKVWIGSEMRELAQ